MYIETARAGLAYIMRERGAERWREDRNGFVISWKIVGRRRLRNYFVPMANVEAAESDLEVDTMPMRWVAEKGLVRLQDSDM